MPEPPWRAVRLESVKFGGVPHRVWERLFALTPSGADPQVLWGPVPTEIVEADGRRWTGPVPVLMHLWAHRAWNAVTLLDPGGTRYYCNVCTGLETVAPGTYRYTDLDLDVLVDPHGATEVADEEEFAANRRRFGYPPAVVRCARSGLKDLLGAIRRGEDPFDPDAVRRWLRELTPGPSSPAPKPR